MRLNPDQVAAIKQAARDNFGEDAVVRLFGSRVEAERKGGDIDLHIETAPDSATMRREIKFRAALWKALDEPQVDVVVMARGHAPRWIDRAAMRDGIIL